jgi:hypothetical protein
MFGGALLAYKAGCEEVNLLDFSLVSADRLLSSYLK